MVIYIASDSELPLIPWIERAPAFHTAGVKPDDTVRRQFTKPHVVYAGSSEGCGCGFFVDEDSDAAEREDSRQLGAYLAAVLQRTQSVELLSCWEGEEGRTLRRGQVVTPAQIEKGTLEIGHNVLVTVTPAA